MENQQLKKDLKIRHITMISIGGVIGAGLFMGSGAVIHSAGPGAVISYALAGLLVIFVMRMLGEMASVNPTSGSFSTYAREAIGPWAGYTIGWLYWFFWVIVIAIEATAGAANIQYWFPEMPSWLLSLILTVLLTLTNVYSVKSYGEFEYWFSIIKVATIVLFLLLGLSVIFGIVPGVQSPGLSNLTGNGGFMPNGFGSVLLGITVVIFSFMGTEIVAVAAGESSEPERAVRTATNSVIWRILIFYVGSIAIVATLLPWNSANILKSPFVAVLEHVGIPAAAQIMNFIVLTAVLSCLNSGLYTNSRMLYGMAKAGDAPKIFLKLNKNGVPVYAVLCGTVFAYVGVIFNYISPDKVFLFLVNSSGGIALLVYLVIAFSHLRMRRTVEKTNPDALKVKMWLYPYLTYVTILGIVAVLVAMIFIDSLRTQVLLTLLIAVLVVGSYFLLHPKKTNVLPLDSEDSSIKS
ncbi:GABA permease [Weizmannia coagulans]|uniref:GABA permease n=2 Tax=Heyndrickxia TaxID=2837504 RepID=A0ABV3NJC0_9BACI|nr:MULTISPECIES: GABA permease [Heyndrickxia]ATW84000.1 GABA permease [Heyndrickxia coagulans]KGB30730.1 GABA permease [Heyndrickxia coagulans]KXT19783.1 GABA permease [Heyndrickxia coagulans]MBT2195002.1 GABA permease [Heyndrickxia coagulans]MBT2237297.1 GABA permease [Heyndrickxia coagulans]